MFTDMVGYTALSQKSEAFAIQLLEMHRSLVRSFFPKHNGREVKTVGDAFLVEFASALEAVRCAFDIQQSMHEMNLGRSPEKQIQLRIGVHVGDVIHKENDVYGDAVNVASRIEPISAPGGLCISRQVYEHVRNKFEFPLVSLGSKVLKNVDEPVEVFKGIMPWEQSSAEQEATFPSNRIAILPFASFSSDPDDAYFADGVTDEIISAVAGISGLNVISRTSVVGYKGTTKKVQEIGKELKVGSILEGTFKKAGNRIRVTTQLIEVAGDRHLWAQNYDRNLDDVFEVQSDVAKQVADALRVKILLPEMNRVEKKPTDSTMAYTYYLKGRHLWNKRGIDEVKLAGGYFERSTQEDPGFSLGYVGQADCCLVLRDNWGIDLDANLEKGKAMAAKALELDPGLAEAHATRGSMLCQEYDFKQAEIEYRKALELKPSYASAHQWYAQLLISQSKCEQALKHIEKAVELDPLSPIIGLNHAFFYYFKRDYQSAAELLTRVIELDPLFVASHVALAMAYGQMKMFEEMRIECDKYVELLKNSFPLVRTGADGLIATLEDDQPSLERILGELGPRYLEAGLGAIDVAAGYFHMGENDEGFAWLERSYSRKEAPLGYLKIDPFFDGIRADPRYRDLLSRLGLN